MTRCLLAPSACLLVVLTASPAVRAEDVPAPAEFAAVRAAIEASMAGRQTPSLAVAVVRDQRVIWAEGFGEADSAEHRRATADSIYRLASVSKPITATGLMILKDRGLVELDAPVNRYLPGAGLRAYAGSADAMTVRRLANHTSGMPVHFNFYYPGTAPLAMDETIRRYGFAATEPGTHWEYSNLAFGILGYVTEVVAGTPWHDFMQANIYDPLGMTRTSDGVRPGREADATVQYTRDAAGRYTPVTAYAFDHPGASVVWSSANDLARFARMHLAGGALDGVRILSEESVRAMQVLTGRRSPGEGTGVAWAVGSSRGRRIISHSGGMPGVSTMLRIYPDDDAAIIVLTNSDGHPLAAETTNRIAMVLFPKPKPPAPNADADQPAAREPATPKTKSDQRAAGNGPPTGPAREESPAPAWPAAWRGKLVHFEGDVPIKLEIHGPNAAELRFGAAPPRPLRDVAIQGERFRGLIDARLATQAGFQGVPTLEFQLRRSGGRATGVAIATAPGYFALAHWVDLATEPAADETQPIPARKDRAAALGRAEAEPTGPYDLLLTGGRVVDGCGTPWYAADVAVRNGRIAAIGRLHGAAAKRSIDCTNLTVAPGFIDMMGQTASPFLKDPNAAYNLLTQGITTINCGEGESAAPLDEKAAAQAGWRTMAEYFTRLEQSGMPLNMVQTVGHTQVRQIVIGDVDRPATPEELERMKSLVREGMEAGAIGVSSALIYPPAVYAPSDEIIELARVAGAYGGGYFTHMRNEGDQLLEAIDEALRIGREAGTPVHIFHLKTAGRANWPKMDQAIARIRAARGDGQQVGADIYPYLHNGLGLRAFMHPRHAAEGQAALLKQLDDPAARDAMRREMETEAGWENWYRHIGSNWDNVVLSGMKQPPYAEHNGKSLGEIARALGRDPWDVFFAVAHDETFALPQSMSEANKIRAMTQDFVSFDTDVGPAGGSGIATHPRAYGSFPRVLSRYVRELGVLSLEEAVQRMSAVAANELFLYERGRLAPGLPADIVVFDAASVADRATPARPNLPSVGIRYVLVNGQVAIEEGRFTGARAGRVLRHAARHRY